MKNNMAIDDFTFDMSDNLLFKKDEGNYIDAAGIEQLNTIGNMSLLDIFLMDGNSIEFHYHPNASEVVYCITGEMVAGFINPSDNKWQHFRLMPGEIFSIPQGFWHYVGAACDDTHLLATFDTNELQTNFGSDILRVTPKALLAEIYCLNEEALEEVLEPIDGTVIIGPPADCDKESDDVSEEMEMKRPHMMGLSGMDKAKRMEGSRDERNFPGMMEDGNPKMIRKKNSTDKKEQDAAELPPVRYGGTVVKEMNVCESCMKEFSR